MTDRFVVASTLALNTPTVPKLKGVAATEQLADNVTVTLKAVVFHQCGPFAPVHSLAGLPVGLLSLAMDACVPVKYEFV